MANKSRNWCVTVYTIGGEDIQEAWDHEAKFASLFPEDDIPKGWMFQLERCPDTGRLHYQGFFIFENPRAFNPVREMIAPHHLERMKGRVSQNVIYCGKEDSRVLGPWRFGELPENQGKRNDLEAFKEAVRNGANFYDLMEEHSNVVAKHPGFVGLYRSAHAKRARVDTDILYPWQTWLLSKAREQPEERPVYWFYDQKGGRGKTWMCKVLLQENQGNVFYSNGGKAADITFGYQGEKIVLFDYTRDYQDYVGYGPMEQLKNGVLFSTKYQSILKNFDPPHVFVFANFEPDFTKLSRDRWRVIRFADEGTDVIMTYTLGDLVIEDKIQ